MRLLARRNSLIAVLTLVAVLITALARLGHVHDESADSGHFAPCKLCLTFERAAGPPAERPVHARLPRPAPAPILLASPVRICDAPAANYSPRAPPLADHLLI